MQKSAKDGFKILNVHKKIMCKGVNIINDFLLPILSANKYAEQAPIIIPE